MDSFNQWMPASATGARIGARKNNRTKSLVGFAFLRLFVLLAFVGLAGLVVPNRAWAQNASVTLTLSTNTFVEGDPNIITGTVSLNGAPITGATTVNIFYQLPAPGGPQTLVDSVVFNVGEENTAKTINITVGDDNTTGNQTVEVIASVSGPAPYGGLTANAPGTQTQIDPHGVFLTEIAAKTSESDPLTGSRTFLDVSLVDPNNPSANLAEIAPTGNVFVSLRVANPNNNEDSFEALIATDAQPVFQQQQVLVFTPQNYQQPQRVYVQGVDDKNQDGDQLYRVIVFARNNTGTAQTAVNSSDPEYNGIGAGTGVFNVNIDNEANPGQNLADVIINPTSITTNENGAIGTFSVVLASAPTADVTINLQTSDATEGKLLVGNAEVNSTSITFSPDDTAPNGWRTPQTVQVKGQDDAIAEPNANGPAGVFYRIITTVNSLDSNYAAIDPDDVGAFNTDNETANLTVSPTFLLVYEGQTASITAVLTQKPTADVRFPVSVTAGAGQVQLNRTEVVFTSANYNIPQTVTVTGVNDNLVDGDRPFTITFGNANSSDTNYNGKFTTTVTGTVVDTNTASVNIQPPGGLTTTEAGGTASFSVSLTSTPQNGTTVTINLTSSDTTEGTVSPARLTFTQANYNVPQTVTITGVDDLLRDGNVDYQINLDISNSTDPNYQALQLQPVTVTNEDAGETAGITITPLGGLTTTEAGGTATFTVQLNAQPTSNVTLKLSSSDTSEGKVAPTSLTFTSTNFNTPQTVTVTGVDDLMDDGDVLYKVITAPLTTNDTTYQFDPSDVLVTNLDDDTRGITVTPTSGLTTNENGGKTTFTVRLTSQPTSSVTIGLSTPFTKEVSVSPASLTFSTSNWNVPQTVTLTGVDDVVIDGARTFVIVTAPATSSDPVYNGLNAADVVGTNNDNDVARVNITPNPLLVREGQSGDLSLTLSAQPTANVIVPLSLNTSGEVVLDKSQLTFTPQNFNIAQKVRVTSIADGINDGNQTVTLTAGATLSGDSNFNNVTSTSTITSLDVVATAGLNITGPTTTIVSENGGIATFSVSLNSQPAANVTLNISSSDTSEGTVNPSSLTFTPANFNTAQTVTVLGADDKIADGNINFTVTFAAPTSSDPNYSGLAPKSFTFTNVDNDRAGFIVTPFNGLATTESGGTATFTVRLSSQPAASVTTTLSTPFTTEITFSPTILTFTTTNWNMPQTVTVKGKDDQVIDGDRSWVLVTSPATSSDPKYNGLNPSDVAGINKDNDTESIIVSPTSLLVREGQSVNVTVKLLGTPTANVVVPVSVNPTGEVVLDKSQLVFTPSNANTPQTVKITSLMDGVADGDVIVTFTAGKSVSPDPKFNNLQATSTITSLDVVAAPGINVTTPTSTAVNESGTTATFDVTLNAQPGANVTINLSSSDTTEGAVAPTSLTFTPANFNTAQTVTVTGVDDFDDDGNVNFKINLSKPVSNDPNYSALGARSFTFVNVDNDTVGFLVTPYKGLVTNESGGTATFDVSLTSKPKANVTFTMTTPFTKEISFSPTTLTFTPVNWNTPQTVTVKGLDDTVQDGSRSWVIVTNKAVSSDAQYNGLDPSDVAGVNQDNEAPGYTVSPTFLVVEEGNTSTFTVRLNLQPTAPVRVPLSVNRVQGQPDQVALNTTALIFTPTNFSIPQTVTVTGIDDNVRDGDQPFSINIGNAISSDPAYNAQHATTLNGTAVDTDVPGVIVNAPSTLTTMEVGGSATFTVALQTSPLPGNTVTINVAVTDSTEATVTPTTLTFDSNNFDIPQTVTVNGVDDGIRDSNQNYQITLRTTSTSDPDYVNVRIPSVNAVNIDNGGAGIVISPASGLTTSEDGTTTTFSVHLINRPNNTVSVVLRSSDLSEGVLVDANGQAVANNSLTLTFDSTNFNTDQTVTVKGVDDAIVDGNVNYSITSRLSSNDPNFNLVGASALMTNTDNDTAGIQVTPTSGFVLSEGNGKGVFTVALTTQPSGNVVIRLQSSDTTEATVNYSTITFFPTAPTKTAPAGEFYAQWNRPVTVTISAVADGVTDGDQSWRIILSRDASATQDDFYKTLDPADVTGLTTDVNLPGVAIVGGTSITTNESDKTKNVSASFTVSLQSQPADNVVIPLSISDRTEALLRVPSSSEFTVGGSLTFTPSNYNVPQKVVVQGVDDGIEDGDQSYFVIIGSTISRSSFYNGIDPADVAGINKDDEDLTAPIVAITSPTDGQILNFIQEVKGTADDVASSGNGLTTGIASVKATLFRAANAGLKQTAAYYNPTTKTFEVSQVADPNKHYITANYNSATKIFSVPLPLTSGSLASGTYTVQVIATDKASKPNTSTSDKVTFVVDSIKPTVAITTPTAGSFSAAPQVQGKAQDNPGGTGIDQTFLTLFREANTSLGNTPGYLLADGTFNDQTQPQAENLLPVVSASPDAEGVVDFTFDFPTLGAGTYILQVQTQDKAGNIGKSSTVRFTLRDVNLTPDFLIGQSYLFSLPYANSSAADATVKPNEAFDIAMFSATAEQRYLLSRYNPLTSSYETLDESALLKRGEGYFIKPLSSNVRILRPDEDGSRVPLNESITTWVYTLRRNASGSTSDPNNGFNLIGNPFNPNKFLAADWQNAIFSDGTATYRGVAAAAAAGLVDSRLFTLNPSTGGFDPVDGNLEIFQGYFVHTFKDNVKVTVSAISATQTQ